MTEPRRLTIVDDDALYLRAIRRSFARAAGVELALLDDADAALDHLDRHHSDIVVLDIYMPGVDGLAACRRLRASSRDVVIVLASVDMSADIRRAALEAGADFAIAKPYDLQQLVVDLTFATLRVAARPGEAGACDRARDAEAFATLIADHLEIALNIAAPLARSYGRVLDREEVRALARLGLCEAAARFDPERPEPFVAFAARRIRGAILDEVRRLSAHTRATHTRSREIVRVHGELERAGEVADDERIAERLGITPREVAETTALTRITFVRIGQGGHDWPSREATPEAATEHREILDRLAWARARLTPHEASVIELHYGEDQPLAAIARTLELDLRSVQKLHARALAKLRSALAD